MKKIKLYIKNVMIAAVIGTFATSCNDLLDLGPIDYYGSESYWKNEEHIAGYIDGMHSHFRSQTWQHVMTFGELRGGTFARSSVSTDGMIIAGGTIRLQNMTQSNPQVSKFGDIFGRITNCNLFIARVTESDFLTEEKKNFYLGQVYGLRAFYYFELYRVYGGVPLRTDVEVIDGVLDPNILYKKRETPEVIMTQVKSDISKSLELFGNTNSFDPLGRGNGKVYWSKAATETLAADVYLWTAKVTTNWQIAGESAANHVANPADIAVAKSHLTNLMNNYGLALQPSMSDVFSVTKKDNSEIIFAVRNLVGEASNGFASFTYSTATGQTQASAFRADGTPWNDPLLVDQNQSYEYSQKLYEMFDENDNRRDDTFLISYSKDSVGNLSYRGSHVIKNIGHINNEGRREFDGDYVIYRLPWVYLSLAEIANYEGNNADVERYMNMVRERAYGDNWDVDMYGYKAGDFTQNELAILNERTKEFIQEGKRWWDLRRMTQTKGGKPLVFMGEASIYGDNIPILDEATQAYKVLWPVDQTLLNNDPLIKQTPGYEINE